MSTDWNKENERNSLTVIAQLIIEKRGKENVDQRLLADLVGTTQTSIRRLEGGETNVSAVLLVRVAKALDMDLEQLLEPIKPDRTLVQDLCKKHDKEIASSTSAMGLTDDDLDNFYTQRDLLRLLKLWPR